MVEAPGVEGRGEPSGFRGLRDGSCREASEVAELPGSQESTSEVSSGLAEFCGSSEVAAGVPESPNLRSARQDLPSSMLDAPANGCLADNDVRLLTARLLALEHVLEAVRALLDVGAVQEAVSLVRGCRRQG
jgi:hypothetical protein